MSAKYRADIGGLRGVAVAAVVLYHAFPDAIIDKLVTHPHVRVFDPAAFPCTTRCTAAALSSATGR